MTANARLGDPLSCGDIIAQGSGDCFMNGMPVARVGDMTAGHCYESVPLLIGAPTVYCNNVLVAMVGNPIPTHTCEEDSHSGVIAVGSPNCFVLNVGDSIQQGSSLVQQYIQPSVHIALGAAQHDDDPECDPVNATFRRKVQAGMPKEKPPSIIDTLMPNPPAPPPLPPPSGNIPSDCSDIYAVTGPFSGSFPLSAHYTLSMVTTNTLVSNYPIISQGGLLPADIVCNLRQLCTNVLEPLYARFGSKLVINSGFRHGSGKSQHYKGQAVDVSFTDIKTSEQEWERAQLLVTLVGFDQFIFEQNLSTWFHLSYNNVGNRKVVLSKPRGDKYLPGLVRLA